MSEPPPTPTGSRIALGILVALVVLSPWPFGSAHPLTRWLITIVCLVTAMGIVLLRLRRKEGVEIPIAAALGAGFFLLGFLQLIPLPPGLHGFLAPGSAAIWHPDVPAAAEILGSGPRPISIWPETTRRAAGFGLGIIALATLAMPALRIRERAVRAATIVVGSAVAVAVYGLIARLIFGDKLFGVLSVPTVAPFGPFVSKNHFAGYVEMGALLALGLAFELRAHSGRSRVPLGWTEGPRAGRVVLAYAAVATLCLAVLVSLSRGGALSLAAGVTAFAVMRSSTARGPSSLWRARGLAAVAVLAVGAAALMVVPQDARQRLQSLADGSKDAATAYRMTVWRDGFQLIGSSPLVGHGLGTFVDALPRFKTGAADLRIEHAENDYLELCAEGGLVGVGLACAAAVAFVRRSTKEVGRAGRTLAEGAAAGLIAIGVHSLVDFNLRIPSNALLCGLLAAVAASKRRGATTIPWTRCAPTVGCIIAGVLVLTLWTPGRLPWNPTGQPVRSQGSFSVQSLRVLKLGDTLQADLRRRPANAEAWVWLAWTRTSLGMGEDADSLAAHGVRLDPRRSALRHSAERLAR